MKNKGERYHIEYQQLRAARLELGLTLEDAARFLKISDSTLSRWETGYMRPTLPEIAMLEEAFGFFPGELIYCGRTKRRENMQSRRRLDIDD